MNEKKKILILIDWFLPGYKAGGPIQSCVNMCRALKDKYDVYVLTTDTDHGSMQPYENIESNTWIADPVAGAKVFYAEKKTLATRQVKSILNEVNPDYVYLNLLFSPWYVIYPLWLKCTGRLRAKVMIGPRGCLYESALSLKWQKKKAALFLYRMMGVTSKVTFHATNERENKAIQKYFPGASVVVANNLPNLVQPAFSSINKEVGSIRCIFIARIVPIKNLLFLLDALEGIKADTELIIAGPAEDELYWEQCKQKIEQLPANIRCRYIGSRQNDEMMQLIRQQHLFVLPTTGENFGHAIFEALLAGRPVLISDQTPWLQLEQQQAGWDLPLNSKEEFAKIITVVAGFDQATFDSHAKNAWLFANKFINTPLLTQGYFQMFS